MNRGTPALAVHGNGQCTLNHTMLHMDLLIKNFTTFFFSPLHKATCSLDFLIEKKGLHCNANIGLKIYCEKTACVNMSRCTNILEIQKTAVF